MRAILSGGRARGCRVAWFVSFRTSNHLPFPRISYCRAIALNGVQSGHSLNTVSFTREVIFDLFYLF